MMKLRILLVAAVLIIPGLAMAEGNCNSRYGTQEATACADGQVWNIDQQRCVSGTTG